MRYRKKPARKLVRWGIFADLKHHCDVHGSLHFTRKTAKYQRGFLKGAFHVAKVIVIAEAP